MPTDLQTANRGYELPHGDNDLAHDIARIISALNAVDADMAQALVVAGVYATLNDPAFTGTPTAPTAVPGASTGQLATTAFVQAAIDALLAAAPGALDTLNELAAALGDDPNFATTMTNALAGKSDTGHLHDDRYYTETEMDASLALKEPADAAILKHDVEQQGPADGGVNINSKDLGNLSGLTITPDPGDRGIQKVTNNGAGTIAAGTAKGCYYLEVINAAGAGAVTLSGFDHTEGEFDTTTTSTFLCAVVITASRKVINIWKTSA